MGRQVGGELVAVVPAANLADAGLGGVPADGDRLADDVEGVAVGGELDALPDADEHKEETLTDAEFLGAP